MAFPKPATAAKAPMRMKRGMEHQFGLAMEWYIVWPRKERAGSKPMSSSTVAKLTRIKASPIETPIPREARRATIPMMPTVTGSIHFTPYVVVFVFRFSPEDGYAPLLRISFRKDRLLARSWSQKSTSPATMTVFTGHSSMGFVPVTLAPVTKADRASRAPA